MKVTWSQSWACCGLCYRRHPSSKQISAWSGRSPDERQGWIFSPRTNRTDTDLSVLDKQTRRDRWRARESHTITIAIVLFHAGIWEIRSRSSFREGNYAADLRRSGEAFRRWEAWLGGRAFSEWARTFFAKWYIYCIERRHWKREDYSVFDYSYEYSQLLTESLCFKGFTMIVSCKSMWMWMHLNSC